MKLSDDELKTRLFSYTKLAGWTDTDITLSNGHTHKKYRFELGSTQYVTVTWAYAVNRDDTCYATFHFSWDDIQRVVLSDEEAKKFEEAVNR